MLVSNLDGDRCQGPKEVVTGVGQWLWAFEAKPTHPGVKPRSPGSQAPCLPLGGCKEGRGRLVASGGCGLEKASRG